MRSGKIYLALLLFTLILGACASQIGNTDDEMIAIVDKFQTARNEGNWDSAASYLAEDVVWETPTSNLTGRDNWIADSESGPTITEYVKSRHVQNNLVHIEMVVEGPDFTSPAKAEAVIENGEIQRYTVIPAE